MKRMIILLVMFISVLSLAGVSRAAAFDPTSSVCGTAATSGASSDICSTNTATSDPFGPNGLVSKIINIFSIVVGIVAIIMIMVGGFEYVTSG
ncbi:MAG TPA: hypothetical protein VNZ45_10620, partial [Bacteroidia bacterium]|nr:hypothetical protein [Bacteroidia bacterium]